MKKITSITILAREWFDKVNGNSYFSAQVYINGKRVLNLPFQYDYGDQYAQAAKEELMDMGVINIKKSANGTSQPLWLYCKNNGIDLIADKAENQLKRDVEAFTN